MRPVDTMPKKGRFLVELAGQDLEVSDSDSVPRESVPRYIVEAWWSSIGLNVAFGRGVVRLERIKSWSPIPDGDSRVVTRAELEELLLAHDAYERSTGSVSRHYWDRLQAARKAVGLESDASLTTA